MSFVEVTDLGTDVTVSLGGVNKKTNKANPKSIEGYYLGKREVEDRKKKSGVSYIYVFQTPKGNVGVWGKTDMDRKMLSSTLGAMTRITHTGFQSTANGEMYKYKVEIDAHNAIEVTAASVASPSSDLQEDAGTADYSSEEVGSFYEGEEQALDEVPYAPAVAPKVAAKSPSSAQQAKVQALLNGNRNRTAG